MAGDLDPRGEPQHWLEQLQAGDASARDRLIEHAYGRLRRLTHSMLKGYSRLKRWEDTDDVLQAALLRLLRALQEAAPTSVPDFFALAATQIRRQLIDLARHYYGPHGLGANHASNGDRSDVAACDRSDTTHEPSRLVEWQEFHERVETLPDSLRQVFDLHWYHGLPLPQVAGLLGVSLKTVKKRWRAARLQLHHVLKDE